MKIFDLGFLNLFFISTLALLYSCGNVDEVKSSRTEQGDIPSSSGEGFDLEEQTLVLENQALVLYAYTVHGNRLKPVVFESECHYASKELLSCETSIRTSIFDALKPGLIDAWGVTIDSFKIHALYIPETVIDNGEEVEVSREYKYFDSTQDVQHCDDNFIVNDDNSISLLRYDEALCES